MFKKVSQKNYLNINDLIIKGMLKRRRMSYLAISKATDSKNYIRIVK